MTRVVEGVAVCPGCGEQFEAEAYSSVNVSLDPGLKPLVLDGSIFVRTCPRCGGSNRFGHNFLYHDMERAFQVELRPEGDPPSPVEADFARIMQGGPVGEGYRLRWVVEGYELAEKIRIFDAELDDRIVEILKAWVLARTENGVSGQTLVFDRLTQGGLRFESLDGEGLLVGFSRYESLLQFFRRKIGGEVGLRKVDQAFAMHAVGYRKSSSPWGHPAGGEACAGTAIETVGEQSESSEDRQIAGATPPAQNAESQKDGPASRAALVGGVSFVLFWVYGIGILGLYGAYEAAVQEGFGALVLVVLFPPFSVLVGVCALFGWFGW